MMVQETAKRELASEVEPVYQKAFGIGGLSALAERLLLKDDVNWGRIVMLFDAMEEAARDAKDLASRNQRLSQKGGTLGE